MLNNPWTSYVTRSYSQIKAAVNARLDTIAPELTDKSPSNLMQVLIDIWAGVGELLNYYTDVTARELYVSTARRFSSILKLAELAGYNGQAAVPSVASVVITLIDANGNPEPAGQDYIIDQGTELVDSNGFTWTMPSPAVIRKGTTGVRTSAEQYASVQDQSLGNTSGVANAQYLLPREYAEGSGSVVVNDGGTMASWALVDTFGYYGPSDKVCLTKLLPDGLVYLVFGDGVHGQVPVAGNEILLTYKSTQGAAGNAEVDSITSWKNGTPIPTIPVTQVLVTNPTPALGGVNIQGIEAVRKNIPLAQRTLGRAVTKKDYEDIASLTPGIRAARLSFDCGPRVKIYVVGEGGGYPTQSLLDAVSDNLNAKSMVTVNHQVLGSGESHVKITAAVVGRFRAVASTIRAEIEEALGKLYDPTSAKINQPVRFSDVIAAMDNVPSVDYVDPTSFYVEPFMRGDNPAAAITWAITVTPFSQGYTTWDATVIDATAGSEEFAIRKGGFAVDTVSVGGPAVDLGEIIIRIPTAYQLTLGDVWVFTVGPYMKDVELKDLTIPVILPSDISLTIAETFIP